MNTHRPVALVLAPSRQAISGVTTHLNLLLACGLGDDYALIHFQVGSEGRDESALGRWWRLVWSPLLLLLRIALSGADIVHINTSLNRRAWWRDLAYLAAAKLAGARVVYQVHGGDLPPRFAAANHLPAAALRAALTLPDAVVVLASSEYSAYRRFVPRQRVLTVPNGIDLAPFRPWFRPYDATPAPLKLLYVGRLSAEKGLPETLEGLAAARRRGVAATLVVAGDGPEEAALKSLAARLGIAEAVQFVGAVFNGDKHRLLESADLLVLPSHHEGLPYALLEGMAAGLPVITTRVGAIPDVVEHGVHGLFVPVRSPRAIARAIVRLAHNRALGAAMGFAAQRRIRRGYSTERLARDFRELYGSLCPRPAAGR